MATQSILKNININNRKLSLSLVNALENAASKHSKDVKLSRTVSDLCADDLKKIFGDDK